MAFFDLNTIKNSPTDPNDLHPYLQSIGVIPTLPSQEETTAATLPPLRPPVTENTPRQLPPLTRPTNAPDSFGIQTGLGTEGKMPAVKSSELPGELMPPPMTKPSGIYGRFGRENTGMELPRTLAEPSGGTLPTLQPPAVPIASSLEPGVAQPFGELPRELPTVEGSLEPYRQYKLQNALEAARPDKMSDHPSFLGKVGHVLGRIGNVALDVAAPGIAENIPGTDMYKRDTVRNAEKNLETTKALEGREKLEAAETKEAEARANQLEGEGGDQLVNDSAGNLVAWRDKDQKLHSFEEPGTPEVLQQIHKDWQGKNARPENFEQAIVGAMQGAQAKGESPKDNQQVQDLMKMYSDFKASAPEKAGAVEGLKKGIIDAMNAGDVEKAKKLQGQLQATDPEGMQRMAETRLQHALLNEDRMDKRREREEKEAEDIVRGYDKNGNEFITSKGNARDMGLQHMTKASGKEIDDAKQNYAALNDMGAKVGNLRRSAVALDQNPYQKTLIQTALRGNPDDYGTRAAVALMSPQSKEYVQDVFSLREAALALPKQTTGGSRVSEPQAHALWNTVPAAAGDSKYADKQLRKFDENLTRLWKKVPGIEGQTAEKPFGGEARAGGGGAPTPRPGYKIQQNKKTGEYREVPENQ